ncbi:MAG TPA: hypothetical protein VM073_02365 [Usitatibacter sp.]|nr:hypothetical protein [Usitatibacter sp.]
MSRPEIRAVMVPCLAIVLGWALFHPIRNAAPFLDDFVFIALARHIDQPLALLTQDALGAYFFRPLVMFGWWVAVALLGPEATGQYALNSAIHALNGLLAFLLLRRHRIGGAPAAIAALLFVAHPTAFAASAWLSARFDLVATAFGLSALIAIERYLAERSRIHAIATVACAFACVASKEIGFALVAAMVAALAWPPRDARVTLRERVALAALISAAALGMLAWRDAAVRPASEGLFLANGVATTLLGGTLKWLSTLADFLVVRHAHRLAEGAWLACLAIMAAGLVVRAARRNWIPQDARRCAVLGLALVAFSALAQAPVTNTGTPVPFSTAPLDHFPIVGSRLHYVPLTGFTLVFGALLQWVFGAGQPRLRHAAGVGVAGVALVALLASSRAIGREWAAYTRDKSDHYVRAAVEAVRASEVQPGCLLFFLDTPAEASLFRGVADTAVKHALAQGDPATACFIQTEHAPWNHLLATIRGRPPSPEPLEVIRVRGAPFLPLRVANLTQFYLRIPGGTAVIDDPRARFFAYRSGRFEEVTGEVRARRREVRFYDERQPG